ncbi:transposase [Streptomyces sp. 900105755]
MDAIFYVVRTGWSWRQLPKGFPPWPTVYWYFTWWHDDGTVANIRDRDGARRPLLWTRLDHPSVRKIRADQGFAGRLVDWPPGPQPRTRDRA